jgi:hypothetical protein
MTKVKLGISEYVILDSCAGEEKNGHNERDRG